MLVLILIINFILLLTWAAFIGIKYLVLYIIERIKTPRVKCEVIYEEERRC